MSSVNDLAVLAKDDYSFRLPLWDAVQRLVCSWANKYIYRAHILCDLGTRLYDVDDLVQSGYLALHDAIASHDPERGEFIPYFYFYVRSRFAEVSGRRGTKRRPEVYASSLNEPISCDAKTTHIDTLADPAADFADNLIERESLCQDYAAIMIEVDKLPDNQRRALLLTGKDGFTFNAAAEVMGVSRESLRQTERKAARTIRRTKIARQIYRERFLLRRVGLTEFKYTHTSEVEKHVLWLEQWEHIYS